MANFDKVILHLAMYMDEHKHDPIFAREILNAVQLLKKYNDDPPLWDPARDQDEDCICGHSYERHFDSWGEMEPVGCKYCSCRVFTDVS